MLLLTEIRKDMHLEGITDGQPVQVVTVDPISLDCVKLVYRTQTGALDEQILYRSDESKLSLAETGRPWDLDGSPNEFRLAAEAFRIKLAHLFDPLMAIHTSNVDPLPHQITAVYEAMLPKQPLRFVLADDPGAGKTIMAGLLIRELIVRGDLERCLVVAPGSLVEQWQDEMEQKFNLEFEIFTREMVEGTTGSNPFATKDLLICRVDQLSRADDLKEKLETTQWDLIIVDEAHKLSASYFGDVLKRTKRYQLGELLGKITRHLLLMTATPHNGKEEDYQAFLALIDSDRFYGKHRDGVHIANTEGIMRRMVKEELVKFDATPLFPERIAETVEYRLDDLEVALYEAVTQYVKTEMNRAEFLDGKRKGSVGFALTILQRRLASSPEAIFQSLMRRQSKMEQMLREAKTRHRGLSVLGILESGLQVDESNLDEIYEDLPGEEVEALEEQVVDQATAAQTVEELEAEIVALKDLVAKARQVRVAEVDQKWRELSTLLQDNPFMKDEQGNRRKIIIFTEHKDTLNYLYDRINQLLGNLPEAIEQIHGGIKREDRRKAVEKFYNYSHCSVLLATDAAGEGVNLQCANLMINYDMPWNPNRIEQRFGRIHRIGQMEVCRLWNLVAFETREGAVYQRLLEKIQQERDALGGKVFDVLGQAFRETPLKDLLLKAIRYGDQPEIRQQLFQVVDQALDHDQLERLVSENALAADELNPGRIYKIKEEMEKAEAQRLQPFYIRAFFEEAFSLFKGQLKPRGNKRWEISHVPAAVRHRDRQIGQGAPVLEQYHRVCFEKDEIRVPGRPVAAFLAPGHPLIDTTVDLVLEKYQKILKRGTVFVDRLNSGTTPHMLFIIKHLVRDGMENPQGQKRTISQKPLYVLLAPDGTARSAGPAPYLDYESLPIGSEHFVNQILESHWTGQDFERMAEAYASSTLVREHFESVKERRISTVEATLEAVHSRLTAEINYWTHRYTQLQVEVEAGRQPRMQPENARRTAEDLTDRLERRTKALNAQRNVISNAPNIIGGALVIPQGLLEQLQGEGTDTTLEHTADADARAEIERIAMEAVMRRERELGFTPRDVSADNCGWDVSSINEKGLCRFIEVKGRQKDATTITVTKNEMLVGFNKKDEGWRLAIVLIEGEHVDGPHYVHCPFEHEPGWAETSVNLDINRLIQQAQTE